MYMKNIILILFMFASALAFSKEDKLAKVWGKMAYKQSTIKGYEYFVTYEDKGELYVFPIKIEDQKQRELIEKNKNKQVQIKGSFESIRVKLDGKTQIITVIKPKEMKFLALNDLAVNKVNSSQYYRAQGPRRNQPRRSNGGISTSDTLTNTAIFLAGAALLGSFFVD